MDVKHTTAATLAPSLGQAHVDPDKGRQGDFEHWHRIFDATERPRAPSAEQRTATWQVHADWPTSDEPGGTGNHPAASPVLLRQLPGQPNGPSSRSLPQSVTASFTNAGAHMPMATPQLSASPRLPTSEAASETQPSADPSSAPTRTPGERVSPDGRPLAQLEAHLSRSADGHLSVALRSSQPLSATQALNAVAQALAAQDGEAPVEQVLLNGQPIYRSAAPSTHRFEIDC